MGFPVLFGIVQPKGVHVGEEAAEFGFEYVGNVGAVPEKLLPRDSVAGADAGPM